jgi:hypothetical protein
MRNNGSAVRYCSRLSARYLALTVLSPAADK